MRTYRLHFSEDGTVLQRRIAKLESSESERALCLGFGANPPPRHLFSGTWAMETDQWSSMSNSGSWDEIHIVLKKPEPIEENQLLNSKLLWVIQPDKLTPKSQWLHWLQSMQKRNSLHRVFVEFEPFISKKPHLLSVHEVARFLSEMKFHFPDWNIQRRPGLELWDSRIPESFELEASSHNQEVWNFQSNKPQLSIVIPTYNNKFFAYRVIEHLSRQSLAKDSYEVILVDDGSSDQTLEYFKTFGAPGKLQLRMIHWPRPQSRHRGDAFFRAGLARNLGVRYARAESLAFLDSDILVPENFVETILEKLLSHDVLQFPRLHILQENSRPHTSYHKFSADELYIEESNYWEPFFKTTSWMSLPNYWKYTCTYALAVKKKDFFEAGRFKRFYVSYGFEDTELGYRLAQLEKKFYLCPQNVLHLTSYSQSEYQMSQLRRVRLLKRTAKQFFLSTLNLENYHQFFSFMTGEYPLWPRIKNGFYWRDKNTPTGESVSRIS